MNTTTTSAKETVRAFYEHAFNDKQPEEAVTLYDNTMF